MCCLFGIIDYDNCISLRAKNRILKVLSKECEARGTDATGIAYIENGSMKIQKKPLPAHKMRFKLTGNPSIIMGHTRMTTQGNEAYNYNNHPFKSEKLGFALAHNGILYNDKKLRKSENIPQTYIETDSYIAVQLIEKKKTLSFDSIKYMAEKVEGSFCFTILSKDNELYIIKGDNPMALVQFNGFYMYASTKDILFSAVKKLNMKLLKSFSWVRIDDGDIIKITPDGNTEKDFFRFRSIYVSPYLPYSNYGYGKKYNSDSFCSLEEEYLENLMSYAKSIGIEEDIITELLEDGYSYSEIEEMLYNELTEYAYEYCFDDCEI